jgi:WD40 repeat protein
MKPTRFGWLATAAILTLASRPALPQDLPPTEPILRIETGTHSAPITRISVDASCRLLVTGSDDKTARLWTLPDNAIGEPKLLRVLRVPIGIGDRGIVQAVALSPDGRFAAAGGVDVGDKDNGVYIFDTASGKMLRRLELNGATENVIFSPDGKYLVATQSLSLRVWNTANWTLIGKDIDFAELGYIAAFDARNNLFTVGRDGFLRRYGANFKFEARAKIQGGAQPYSIAVHPKGDRVVVGYFDTTTVDVYDAVTLRRLFAADTTGETNGSFPAVAWSSDGARLYAGARYQNAGVRIWDREGRGEGRRVAVARSSILQLAPCRDSIAVASIDPAFGLISATGEKQAWVDSAISDMRGKTGQNFTVSEDGARVRFGLGYGGERPILFDLATSRLTDQPQPPAELSAPDIETLALTDWDEKKLTPKLNGTPIKFSASDESRSLAIAPGGDLFVLGATWSLKAYAKDGNLLWERGTPSIAWGVNIPRSGKFVVAAYNDGTIRWHRLSDGKEVLALFVNSKTREWVLWTPQGYFNSSIDGDQMVGWHLNKGWAAGEFVTAARLKKHLFRPDIVKRAFELADAETAVREAGLSGFELADLVTHAPPEFRILGPGDKTHADKSPVDVRLALGVSNDPVTGFDVKVNGRQVTPRDVRDIPQPAKDAETRNLSIPLEKGENHIQVVARNEVGETVQDLLVYLDREGALNRKGKLYIVAVGVDKYPKLGSRYTLRFAGADARLMLDTLAQRAGPLHTEVVSKLLVSDGDTPPTKANIEDALAIFRDARPEDTVILFLASHGVNDGPNYLMIPEDAERNEANRWRPSSVVKWFDLQQALQDAEGSRIMFVDTCHSSGAYSPRLVKDAANANIVVFSATDKDTEAQETSKLGHGVFTYAVSQGINGGADFGKKGLINMWALAEYVSDEVKRLTNDEQEPVVSTSGVKNFILAAP